MLFFFSSKHFYWTFILTCFMILNITKQTVLAERKKFCDSFWKQLSGLMFRPEKYVKKHSLIFKFNRVARQPFHMFFVFYPIDIIFLDEKKCVVEFNDCFMPFEVYHPKSKAKYALELPTGTISSSYTEVGDHISW